MPNLCDSRVSRWFSVFCTLFLNFLSFLFSRHFSHSFTIIALCFFFSELFCPVIFLSFSFLWLLSLRYVLFPSSFALCSIDKLCKFLISFYALGFQDFVSLPLFSRVPWLVASKLGQFAPLFCFFLCVWGLLQVFPVPFPL